MKTSHTNNKATGRMDGADSRASLSVMVLLPAVATLGTLALFEIGLRLVDYNPMGNQRPRDIVSLRVQEPGSQRFIDVSSLYPRASKTRVRVDSRSYIQPALQFSEPHVTIAFLGGSTTECTAVEETIRFPALVSQLLSGQQRRVNTLNAGHGGNTMHDSINILLNHVVFDRPDVVVVMNVANDVGILGRKSADYRPRSARPLMLSDATDWLKWTASELLYLAGVARQALVVFRGGAREAKPASLEDQLERTSPEYASTLPSHLFEQRVRVFVGVARGLGMTPVLLTEPFSGSRNELTPDWAHKGSIDLFNDIVRKVGQEEQVLVIDLVRHLQETVPDWHEPMRIFYDGIHVTNHGSETYARYIAQELAPLVEQIASDKETGLQETAGIQEAAGISIAVR